MTSRINTLDRERTPRGYRAVGSATAVLLGLLIAGCSGNVFDRSSAPSSSPSLGDKVVGLLSGKPPPPSMAPLAPITTAEDIDCPTVMIRQGASTYSASMPGVEPTALTLRYQATFVTYSRDCKVAGASLTMRVGVEGRVILGPAGSPGTVEVPLRYAVVAEGPEPKTITTKLRWFNVVVPPGETNVAFTEVEDDLTFPTPRRDELEAYVVYIGFDSAAVKTPEKKKPAKKPAPVAKRNP